MRGGVAVGFAGTPWTEPRPVLSVRSVTKRGRNATEALQWVLGLPAWELKTLFDLQ